MNWLVYLLQVNLALFFCWALFYVVLRPLTFFKWNRLYLLGSVILSFIAPLFTLQVTVPMEGLVELGTIDWQYVDHLVTKPLELTTPADGKSAVLVFSSLYLLVSCFLLVLSLWRSRTFYFTMRRASKISSGKIKVYLHKHPMGSFTVFRRIYMNEQTHSSAFSHVLRHEMVHASQLHSMDLLLMKVLLILFWFNPFVFLLLRCIRENHEYLADDEARKTPDSLVDYLGCLKAETLRMYSPVFASHFKCSSIKKRIIMLTTKRSNRNYKWRYLGFLPLLGFMLVLFHSPAENSVATTPLNMETRFFAAPSLTGEIPAMFPLPASYREKITWGYNKEAIHPISGKRTTHLGIDVAAPTGTPVYATGSGTVKKAENQDGWGMLIVLEHQQGYATLYAHLDRFEVKSGDRVNMGQLIGRVGNTGQSTGPHLHYEVRKEGTPLDPADYY